MQYILPIQKITKDDLSLVGKKALSLALMHEANIPIPAGFIITTDSWRSFLESGHLKQVLEKELTLLDPADPLSIQRASQSIQQHIRSHTVPKDIVNHIFNAYESIDGQLKTPEVAVRISPTAKTCHLEQDPLFLNIRGEASVLDAVRNIWADMFNPITMKSSPAPFEVETAIVVQKMIPATVSGLLHTVDTRTEDKQHHTIEAIWGLGEYLAHAHVQPDRYFVDKDSGEIIKKEINQQQLYLTKVLAQTQEKKVDKRRQLKAKLSDQQIFQLVQYARQLRKINFYQQTAEWVLAHDQFYFVETQPYADYELNDQFQHHPLIDQISQPINIPLLAHGIGVSPGIAAGRIHRLHHASEIADLDKHELLLVSKCTPEIYPAVRKVAGIISLGDGIGSPVAILARELGTPAVLGATNATHLRPNQLVTIDGKTGTIHSGKIDLKTADVAFSREEFVSSHQLLASPPSLLPSTKTATKIFVGLPSAHSSDLFKFDLADGVANIRGEYILTQLPQHPKAYFEHKKEKYLIDRIYRRLLAVVEQMGGKDVFYHFSDITSALALELLEGNLHEPEEINPIMGYRGSFRHLFNPELLRVEITAIKKVREEYKNLHLVIPLVRSTSELNHMFKFLKAHQLAPTAQLKIYLSLATPANLIDVAEYAKLGVEGIIIDLSELTKFMLGVDPANSEVAQIYNPIDSSIVWLLKQCISFTSRSHIVSIISGSEPGIYPEFTEILIKAGLSAICVPSDLLHAAKRFAIRAEQKLIK